MSHPKGSPSGSSYVPVYRLSCSLHYTTPSKTLVSHTHYQLLSEGASHPLPAPLWGDQPSTTRFSLRGSAIHYPLLSAGASHPLPAPLWGGQPSITRSSLRGSAIYYPLLSEGAARFLYSKVYWLYRKLCSCRPNRSTCSPLRGPAIHYPLLSEGATHSCTQKCIDYRKLCSCRPNMHFKKCVLVATPDKWLVAVQPKVVNWHRRGQI